MFVVMNAIFLKKVGIILSDQYIFQKDLDYIYIVIQILEERNFWLNNLFVVLELLILNNYYKALYKKQIKLKSKFLEDFIQTQLN